ncbi:DUF5606 family protein [Alkalitalea saponilacus]|uniref:Uncharacterized protein n=1 Tax=Alkalitalea saponilacus TaxID=889453 RepID=A0A1T5H5U0_9BACT|nr:DUF5606 domain-containing protein [Alkalitalea saponilacus]ASB50864.1 hypothetical protein CDL62_17765 [Alkalitalea saponilacus]SKC16055.1 hypothetical protein SAMN03080601_02109 [Alkalitalea saponilacus]
MVKDILAISGYSGLFKLVSQAKNSVIVESLTDGKRMPAYATSKISALEDISIYTEDEDVRLSDIFVTIFEKAIEVDPKADAGSLKKKFEEILPDYDKDRVYVSDIKKVYMWFNLLKEKGIITEEAISKYKEEKDKEEESTDSIDESENK